MFRYGVWTARHRSERRREPDKATRDPDAPGFFPQNPRHNPLAAAAPARALRLAKPFPDSLRFQAPAGSHGGHGGIGRCSTPPATNAAGTGWAAALRGRSFSVFEAAAAVAPPQAPAPARTAAALRGVLARVADALALAFCCFSWANIAANGAAVAARWACGEDSRAPAAAKEAADAAFVAMAVLIPVAGPRLFWIIERWPKAGDRQSGSGIARRSDAQLGGRPASGGGGARHCQNAGPASVTLALVVVYSCVPVMLVGQLIKAHAPGMGSYQEKFGSALSIMATLIAMLVLCFFLIPGMIIQLRRHGM